MLNFIRQSSRYRPESSDPYFEVNLQLTSILDDVKNSLKKKRILDIGAGEVPFGNYYDGLHVETCDIQQNSSLSIEHIISPTAQLPFQDGSYDVIFIFDVLEHVEDDLLFISECNRILSPGGRVIATVPFMYRFHEEPNDYRRYTPTGLSYIFEKKGNFLIETIIPLGSTFFSANKLINERRVFLPINRRILYRIISWMLTKFNSNNEVTICNPFLFYLSAIKK